MDVGPVLLLENRLAEGLEMSTGPSALDLHFRVSL